MKNLDSSILIVMLASLALGCSAVIETQETGHEDVSATQASLTAPFELGIVPSGSGCPVGTWTADIAPDGKSHTVAFSNYELTVEPRTSGSPGIEKAESECKLTLTFNPTSDVQYSVGDFYYSGYAYLEPGVKARLVTTYKFSNTPEQIKEHSEFAAPSTTEAYDQDFLIKDSISLPDGEWTKCRKREVLKVNTRVVLKNPEAKRSGYIDVAAMDGEFSVRTRPCTP
jgi:hypothetical protein